MGNYTMLGYVGGNIGLEFLYSGPHSLLRRMHLNNATRSARSRFKSVMHSKSSALAATNSEVRGQRIHVRIAALQGADQRIFRVVRRSGHISSGELCGLQ